MKGKLTKDIPAAKRRQAVKGTDLPSMQFSQILIFSPGKPAYLGDFFLPALFRARNRNGSPVFQRAAEQPHIGCLTHFRVVLHFEDNTGKFLRLLSGSIGQKLQDPIQQLPDPYPQLGGTQKHREAFPFPAGLPKPA